MFLFLFKSLDEYNKEREGNTRDGEEGGGGGERKIRTAFGARLSLLSLIERKK